MTDTTLKPIVDCLQYAKWSKKIFEEMREGGVHAVHVTIAYHETFREMVLNIEAFNRWFEQYPELIFMGRTGDDIRKAVRENRTAIFFGFQNPSAIEDDIGLIEICHTLGARFMQLSYNNQSLLATGCYEAEDPGITRFGKQAIANASGGDVFGLEGPIAACEGGQTDPSPDSSSTSISKSRTRTR